MSIKHKRHTARFVLSSFNYMAEPKPLALALLGCLVVIGFIALIALFGIYHRVGASRRSGCLCCGHCAALLRRDPVREVALEDQSLLAFQCSACGKQTYLSSADLE